MDLVLCAITTASDEPGPNSQSPKRGFVSLEVTDGEMGILSPMVVRTLVFRPRETLVTSVHIMLRVLVSKFRWQFNDVN